MRNHRHDVVGCFQNRFTVFCDMRFVFACLLFASTSLAGDWPMWRYNAERGASTPDGLPAGKLHLQWSRQLPEAAPAWPTTQGKLQFDIQAEPVVMGEQIFVPSSKYDSITAFSTRTGEQLWRFFADGPIRFAPVAHEGNVYFNSDDANLYAVDAKTGKLIWKVNGAPERRWLLGNHRLISAWPSRGGPVLHDGKLYFAASVWPFMGIFIHAIDPETGTTIWTNSGDGTNYTVQPHDSAAFAGVVPQGHIAANGKNLVIPGGRSTPGIYDTETGVQRSFEYDKKNGGHDVMATSDLLFVAGHAYLMKNGKPVGGGAPAVFDDIMMIASDPNSILARALVPTFESKKSVDRKGKTVTETETKYRELFRTTLDTPMPGNAIIKAGDRLYSGGVGTIAAYDLQKPVAAWTSKIDGEAYSLLAADDRLFVVAREGKLLCFGADEIPSPTAFALEESGPQKSDDSDGWAEKAKTILEHPGASEGYAIIPNIGSGRLIDELLRQSPLYLIAIDPDAKKVLAIRERMVAAGLYGSRFSAFVGDPESEKLPAYLCNLITSELPFDLQGNLANSLRPFGGIAISFSANNEVHSVCREGAPPNSDDWTHQYGTAAQTVVSKDGNVKAPFGVLWFGGPSHEGVLPRHGHGPSPQIAGGRLFIEGADMLRAVDVYTGRKLWEKSLPGIGEYYDTTLHFPGAGEIGSNYVSLPDTLYAVMGPKILALNTVDGEIEREFVTDSFWGHLSVEGDFLIATSAPVEVGKSEKDGKSGTKETDSIGTVTATVTGTVPTTRFSAGSRTLTVFNRKTGEKLWDREAEFNFRHNNIAVSEDRIFCIDKLTDERAGVLTRRGLQLKGKPTLYALDLKTGDVLWKQEKEVFGTFVNYSAEHDILLQAGSKARDRAADDIGRGMMALRGKTGEVVWYDPEIDYNGPCLLWHDQIITNGNGGFGLSLLSGKKLGWTYDRGHGCNTAIGSEHMLTFRSAAAGFFDLDLKSGTGNLGGFKSSCTNNLIVANGVLNAPDYTRTCTCSYQNQTSLALVHMPEAEFWTYGGAANPKRIGVNFGAPGDRKSEAGTLFTEYPSVGGKSEEAKITIQGSPIYSRVHSLLMNGGDSPWLTASAMEGATEIAIELPQAPGNKPVTVRLWFAEHNPEIKKGDRIFDLSLAGLPLETGFDIVQEAGGSGKGVMKEFKLAKLDGTTLKITLRAHPNSLPPLLSAVEIVTGDGK